MKGQSDVQCRICGDWLNSLWKALENIPSLVKNIEHLNQTGLQQEASGAFEAAFALKLPLLLPWASLLGCWNFSFSCAGNLKKGVLKRKNPVSSQACIIIPACLLRQVTGIHGVHGSSAWCPGQESIWWRNAWLGGRTQNTNPDFHHFCPAPEFLG